MAFDLGINYVDVARSYGYGEAEQLLGFFLRGKRDRIVVATKFGIETPRIGRIKRLAKMVVRPLFATVPAVRHAVRNVLGGQHHASMFSEDALRHSLEMSLRQLKTDYIDVFLLHSCTAEIFGQNELFEALHSLMASGKIRHVGLATASSVIAQGLTRPDTSFDAAQFEFGLLERSAGGLLDLPRAQRLLCIAHGIFGGGGRNVQRLRLGLAEIARRNDAPAELRRKLSGASADVIADASINAVLRGTGIQIALCSMIRAAHLERNAGVTGRSIFTDRELAYIRDHFARRAEPVTKKADVLVEAGM
jgi:aryl-alcohol dehydrogenase-like predicted oxidoreductase